MKSKQTKTWVCFVMIFFAISCLGVSNSFAADVDVYLEGAYTASDLVVYIYADITPAIVSYGVKLNYNTAELAVVTAEKNEAVWYFGDGATNHSYMDPETGTAGEVIIIGGKLDTSTPTAGVSGTRVLLGKVIFNRTGTTTNFGLSLTFGRDGDTVEPDKYENFVMTDGTLLDGSPSVPTRVSFLAPAVFERGDANADGHISPVDMLAIRNAYYGGASLGSEVAADCNGDGKVTQVDILCVRNKYYNP